MSPYSMEKRQSCQGKRKIIAKGDRLPTMGLHCGQKCDIEIKTSLLRLAKVGLAKKKEKKLWISREAGGVCFSLFQEEEGK